MLEIAMKITIETLWSQGRSKAEIARLTGHDWKTVAKVITALKKGETLPVKKPHAKKLDKHKEFVMELLEQNLTGVRIFEELRSHSIDISYSAVKQYIAIIKKRTKVCIRFHTNPGEEAQVDFGYAGLTLDNSGKKRKTWVFNMRLSYSRLDYFEKVYNQKVETFIQCHINAFEYFQGIPSYIKIDNLKAAILEATFYAPVYQRLYKQFAEYYKFKPLPCRVRQPQEKGKTESGIKYVKNNFFLGRKFKDEDDLDRQLKNWLNNTCNTRIHGTTRKVPRELFDVKEKDILIKLPEEEFKIPNVGQRLVYHDWHVYIEYNYYSVPFEYVGEKVDIELNKEVVRILLNGKQIAIHARDRGKGNFITEEAHCPKYKNHLSTEYQEKYQVKMSEIGIYAGQIFLLILSQHPQAWNRPVCGILSLVKEFSCDVVNLACKRALAFNITHYQMIKSICNKGSYKLPIEFSQEEAVNEHVEN